MRRVAVYFVEVSRLYRLRVNRALFRSLGYRELGLLELRLDHLLDLRKTHVRADEQMVAVVADFDHDRVVIRRQPKEIERIRLLRVQNIDQLELQLRREDRGDRGPFREEPGH